MTGGLLLNRNTAAPGTVTNETVPLGNSDLILVQDAADAPDIIIKLRRN